MILQSTIDDLKRHIQDLRGKIELHEGLATAMRGQLEEAEKFVEGLIERGEGVPSTRPNAKKLHGHLTPSHIAHCTTQRTALEEIAKLSRGLANPTEAAIIIMDAGMSKSKERSSLVSTLQKLLGDEDVWEWRDAGVYRLKGFTPPVSFHPDDFTDEQDPMGWEPD